MYEASAKIVVIGGSPSARGQLLAMLRGAKLQVDVDQGASARPSPRLSVEAIRLTPRELEVLALLASGRSYRAIAEELEIGLSTVQTYVKSTYRKLGVSSRAEAARMALQMGLVDWSDDAGGTQP